MEGRHPIRYGTEKEHAFIVNCQTNRFNSRETEMSDICMPSYIKDNHVCATNNAIESVEENMNNSNLHDRYIKQRSHPELRI